MPRAASALRLVAAAVLFTAPGIAAAQKQFVDMDRDELIRAIPELSTMQFDPSQDRLDGLLRATGAKLAKMFEDFADASMAETIHEMRFEGILLRANRPEDFRYFAQWIPDDDNPHLKEFRADARTGTPVTPAIQDDVLVSGRFLELLNCLLPRSQSQSHFRYLGRAKAGEHELFVVAFAQREPGSEGSPRQGLAWIDAATHAIVRLRVESASSDALTSDISFVPVSAPSLETATWLPSVVTVHARCAGLEYHSVHRYSDYRLDDRIAGVPSGAAPAPEDAYELLARAIALEDQPAASTPFLREALRLDPSVPQVRYYLAAALWTSGDATGAEAELREAARRAPELGPVHNLLGVVLAKRDLKAAVAEFRVSAQLQPKAATVHFNLGQVLEKLGDRPAALEEYRAASTLDPDNGAFKARYEQLARAPVATPAPVAETIRVDVRQVVVPVVVTDREGHHIPGLTRADFQVFEDGVEQKISGFSVERAAAPASSPDTTAGRGEIPATPAQPHRPAIRRTYLICLDTLHAEFGNLVRVREALSKLFASEQPGDAQYIVAAVGLTTELLQNTTSDAGSVLKAIQSKSFEKLYLASTSGVMRAAMQRYRRELDDVRALCDAGDPSCPSRKRTLPLEAEGVAAQHRAETTAFLRQLRALVEQLARATDRRTVVLLSDGFGMVPGREAFELLNAYFPDIPFVALRTVDRMQSELEPVLRIAANSNITVHTIDTRGLYTQEFFKAENSGGSARAPAAMTAMDRTSSEAGGTLIEIAAVTGGTAFQNSNDMLRGLQKAFSDGREYYTLAYVPGNANWDGKFRSISVKVRNNGKVTVSAKRGYWANAE